MHMPRPARKLKKKKNPVLAEVHSEQGGEWLRDLILGGQDGLVNVLGLVLGVAAATQDTHIIIVAGFAALFAEGISMGAVAYTSTKAALEFYAREKKHEEEEILEDPELEKQEVRKIYYAKGFRGKQLEYIVHKITSNHTRWVNVMMEEELKLFKDGESPLRSGIIVGIASLIGAVFPLIPFFILPVQVATLFTVPFSLIILFIAGAIKGRFTKVVWWRSGLELALIGTGAAVAGFLIGSWLGAVPGI
jgi:VIT1/CCC1 family predicted Fe2+/Mn2+ transporter